ncbi:MAG TPA: hypothetical protein VJZ06_07800 [Mobilitalea sp.]|nr:hypothetical protein [Mobilitalea sp.]
MINVFITSFQLRNTYKTNGTIFSLKSIPLVRRLLPSSLYGSRALKRFANIISIILELFSVFLGKAIYIFIAYWVATLMTASKTDSFAHILIFLTAIGGFLNTQMFNPTKDKFYAISIMRMNARRYTLSNYLYFLMKTFVGLLPFTLLFGTLIGMGTFTCLAVPVYVVSVKLCYSALTLKNCLNKEKKRNENNLTPLMWIAVGVLLAVAFLPPYLGYAVSNETFYILIAVLVIPTIFAFKYIMNFSEYKRAYNELLKPESFAMGTSKSTISAAQQLASQKKISIDPSQISNKTGYQYFNELFMKRHSKLLTRSAKRTTIIAILLFVTAVIACFLFPEKKEGANKLLHTALPYFLFVMYMINSGKYITHAMFMNCDHSMLSYSFYRKPKSILQLFIERLKYIIIINLMPATVIALGLPILLYFTGGTEQPLNYLLLFISIMAMSVFFSVHNIVLYYLLQPFNINLESKSATFGIANSVTYFLCYFALGKEIPTLIFGSAISVFCILYAAIAFVLAYRLAPKTFRLKQ